MPPDPPAPTPPVIPVPITTITPEVVTPPAVPPAPPTVPSTSQAAPPVPPVVPAGPVQVGDEGDIPEDAEILQMSKGALKKRLDRATRSQLRERFGTDDPEAIKAQLDELKVFKAQQEEQRLASLSDIEREKEARAKAEGERDAAVQQYEELRTTQQVRQVHTRVSSISEKHFKDNAHPVRGTDGVWRGTQEQVLFEFAGYLNGLPEDQANTMSDQTIEQWFADRAKTVPEWSKGFAPPAPPVPVVPLTNGPPAAEGAPPQTGAAGQAPAPNYSPSAPNAMKPGDARVAAAKEGYHY